MNGIRIYNQVWLKMKAFNTEVNGLVFSVELLLFVLGSIVQPKLSAPIANLQQPIWVTYLNRLSDEIKTLG